MVLALLISLIVVGAAAIAVAQDAQKAEAAALLVKAISQEEAADPDSVIIIRPFFIRGEKGGVSWIDYDFGGVTAEYLGFPASDPYRLPYVMQIQVEALRKVFEENAMGQDFWRAHLDRGERIMRLAVADIESTPDRRKLDAKLTARSGEFRGMLDALERSIQAYAAREKLQIGEPGVGRKTRFGEKEAYPVRVITEPGGGKVRVVTAFVWRTCLRKTCDKERLVWQSLNVGGTEGLIGGYHYIAEWGDGRRDEGDMKIDREQERTFRPFTRQ